MGQSVRVAILSVFALLTSGSAIQTDPVVGIPPGMRAVTVRIRGDVLVRPFTRVDVLAGTALLLEDVEVLDVLFVG